MTANSTALYIYCCLVLAFEDMTEISDKEPILDATTHCYKDTISREDQWLNIYSVIRNVVTNHNKTNNCRYHHTQFTCSQNPQPEFVLYMVFWMLVMLIAFFGNAIVLLSVYRSLTLQKSITNYFIASLAASDLLVSITIVPVKILNSHNNISFCASLFVCRLYITLDTIFFVASITNLFAISIDRFIAVEFPYQYPERLTPRRVKVIIACIWVYAILWGFPVNINWEGEASIQIIIQSTLECVVKNKYYVVLIYCTVFYLPVLVMGGIYARVFQITRHHAKRIAETEIQSKSDEIECPYISRALSLSFATKLTPVPSQTEKLYVQNESFLNEERYSNTTPYLTPNGSPRHVSKKISGSRQLVLRVTKTVATIYGLFLVCWLPVSILSIGLKWCPNCFRNSTSSVWQQILFADVLPVLNSTLNPFVYALMNKQYRRAFRTLIRDIWSRVPNFKRARSPTNQTLDNNRNIKSKVAFGNTSPLITKNGLNLCNNAVLL